MATRDFVRSELSKLVEELDEAQHRRTKLERKERKAAKRAAGDEFDADVLSDAG